MDFCRSLGIIWGMRAGKFLGFLLALILTSSVFVGEVRANEGVFKLGSVGGSSASCYVLSVFQGSSYKILGTCRNLVVPFSAEINHYVMWEIGTDGNIFRIGEVQDGKIGGQVKESFVSLMVTAEGLSSPRKPSERVVAKGDWENVPLVGVSNSVLVAPVVEKKVVKAGAIETVETKETSGLVKFLSVIGRIVGIGFLLVLVLVVVMTVVMRRKERI